MDEWGAVVKRQVENYQREQEESKVRAQFQKQKYGDELRRDIENREKQRQVDQV